MKSENPIVRVARMATIPLLVIYAVFQGIELRTLRHKVADLETAARSSANDMTSLVIPALQRHETLVMAFKDFSDSSAKGSGAQSALMHELGQDIESLHGQSDNQFAMLKAMRPIVESWDALAEKVERHDKVLRLILDSAANKTKPQNN